MSIVDIQLTRTDFDVLGDLANNCELSKLNIAVKEAVLFDLPDLFDGTFYALQKNWGSVDSKWVSIRDSKEFAGCKGKETYHLGIKTVIAYFAYARYIMINGFNDTSNGQVQKTNDFSIPKTFEEIRAFSNKYKSMGRSAFRGVCRYIAVNKDTYKDDFEPLFKMGCGCNEDCNGSSSDESSYKGTGTVRLDSSIITKN